jgi:hypothetical protein
VKDENGDLLADSHNVLNIWKNYFTQLLNVHMSVMLGRNKYIWLNYQSLILALRGLNSLSRSLKKYKSPGSDQILAVLIRAGCESLLPVIHEVIYSIWNIG